MRGSEGGGRVLLAIWQSSLKIYYLRFQLQMSCMIPRLPSRWHTTNTYLAAKFYDGLPVVIWNCLKFSFSAYTILRSCSALMENLFFISSLHFTLRPVIRSMKLSELSCSGWPIDHSQTPFPSPLQHLSQHSAAALDLAQGAALNAYSM